MAWADWRRGPNDEHNLQTIAAAENRFGDCLTSACHLGLETRMEEMGMRLRRFIGLLAIATLWAPIAFGQAYPNKPVHVVVPFTAGSATDILARTYGQKLSE